MIGPIPLDLKVYRGDNFGVTVTITDKHATPNPVPLPTDGEWKAQIRRRADMPKVYAAMTVDASNGSDGKIRLTMTDEQTSELSGEMVYDVENTKPGLRRTYLKGTITFERDVTR